MRAEQRAPAADRRLGGPAGPGLVVLLVLVLAGVTYVTARSGDSAQSAAAPLALVSTPFGPHYDGLVQRRKAARVPTMMDTMRSRVHFHPLLKVFVDGKQVAVPANIGIDPRVDGMQMAGLHTHDTSGTVHVEGVPGARLGQFFTVWGVPLSPDRLGPHRVGAGTSVRMWVNGKPSAAFGALKLVDGQRIVVSLGPSHGRPPEAVTAG